MLASLVMPGQLVFLDGGTTSAALVGHLPPDLAITVATHSPTIASLLIAHPTIAVELIGGRSSSIPPLQWARSRPMRSADFARTSS